MPAPQPAGPGGGLSAFATLPPAPKHRNPLDQITPVTDLKLVHSADGEWLTWRRSYDDLGFSPLKQNNRTNARDLRVAWTWSLPAGPNEMTPLVHDGVLFVFGFGDHVEALEAASGDLLWEYSRQRPKEVLPSVKRNLALYGDRLLVPSSDSHLVALDIKTGKVIWDRAIGDYRACFRITGGPLAAKDKVNEGVEGRAPGEEPAGP